MTSSGLGLVEPGTVLSVDDLEFEMGIGIADIRGGTANLHLHPSPVVDRLKKPTSSLPIHEVTLLGMDGCPIGLMPLNVGGTSVDVSGLSAGPYLVQVWMQDGRMVCQRFIKHKP